jgi:hypothetical protein
MNMKTMARKREGDMQVESHHWAGWENANIFCFMIAKSRATQYAISKLWEELCKTILTLLSMIPVGVCSEVEDAGDVNSK